MSEEAKKSMSLTPSNLRIVLIVTIALLIAIAGVGFWFFRETLVTYATQVATATEEANASGSDIANLQRLETELKDNEIAVNRAKNIVADSQSYQYQNQIISDLNAYAKSSGITISSFGFADESAAPTNAGGAAAQPVPAVGLKSTTVNIAIKNPVDYRAILKFIHSLEINLTKMQLSGISMTRSTEGTNMVSINPITVEVYIK